jgi:hypothetical protein
MWTANELLRQHSTRFTFFLQPPPVYPIAVVADAGSLCPFLFGPRNIIYTVASIRILLYRLYCYCAQRDRKVLIPFLPLIFVCNFLLLIDDRLLFLSSNLLFDRLLVNEELKWAALLARSGRYFWAIDIPETYARVPSLTFLRFFYSIISANHHVFYLTGRSSENLDEYLSGKI